MTAIAAAPALPVAPATPAAPNPGAAPNAPGGEAEAGGFARELQRAHQGRDKPAAPTRPEGGARKPGAQDGEARTEEADTPAPAAGDVAAAPRAAGLDLGLGQEPATAEDDADAAAPALDVSALLAGWTAPTAAPAAPRATPTAAAAAGDAAAPALAAPGRAAKAAEPLDLAAAKAAPGDARAEPRTAAPEAANPFMLPAALPAGAAGAAGGAALAAPADGAARGAPRAEAQIEAPVGSAGFAPALGAEVSMFVKEGVQEARLHLNPAELGPITVQIQIEGDQAQVTMSAEQAPTRQALEQALPTLAGALRENGLTLTGGGVFEQPRQPRDGQPAAPTGRRGEPAADDDGPAAVGNAARAGGGARGVVDLYA